MRSWLALTPWRRLGGVDLGVDARALGTEMHRDPRSFASAACTMSLGALPVASCHHHAMRLLQLALLLPLGLACGTSDDASPSAAPEEATFREGDVLASRTDPVRVSKIVHIDELAFHVLTYQEEFPDVDAARAAVEHGSLSVLIGHAPIARAAFTDESHVVLRNEPVTEQDLEGYRTYQQMQQ